MLMFLLSAYCRRHRCSGFNNCTVQLENDEPQAKQWGNGKLRVLYNCIPGNKLNSKKNKNILNSNHFHRIYKSSRCGMRICGRVASRCGIKRKRSITASEPLLSTSAASKREREREKGESMWKKESILKWSLDSSYSRRIESGGVRFEWVARRLG